VCLFGKTTKEKKKRKKKKKTKKSGPFTIRQLPERWRFFLKQKHKRARAATTPFFGPVLRPRPRASISFRRPSDATFVPGALSAILAGYMTTAGGPKPCQPPPARALGRRPRSGSSLRGRGRLAGTKNLLDLATAPIAAAALWLATSLALLIVSRVASRARTAIGVAALLCLVGDLAFNNGPNESTALAPATYAELDPQVREPLLEALKTRVEAAASDTRIDRVELTGLGFHWPNASLVHRLHNVLGYNPVRLGLYSAATGAEDHVALPEQRKFFAAVPILPLAPRRPPWPAPHRHRRPDRTCRSEVEAGRPDAALRRNGGFFSTRTPAPCPAYFLQAGSGARISSRWSRPDAGPMSISITRCSSSPPLPAPERPTSPDRATPAKLRIAAYRNTEIVVEVDAAAPGHLVLNDPFHPWWFAEIDGRETEIRQANVLFQGRGGPGRASQRALHLRAASRRMAPDRRPDPMTKRSAVIGILMLDTGFERFPAMSATRTPGHFRSAARSWRALAPARRRA
jgi:hypothetical protein